MIKSFGNRCAEHIFHGVNSKDARQIPSNLRENAFEKLDLLHAAARLDDLKIPPGNRLKPLQGNLSGFWSIRINSQWRIVFRWVEGNAEDVKICDYH